MHFVDDEDFVTVADRRHAEALDDDGAHLVDLRIRRGVDLDYVHVATLGDLDAGVALTAGLGRWSVEAVQAPRQNPRRRRLANAARP